MRKTTGFRLQSAMEYLMTYGWAILIIAVVLGALYSLGVFNGTAFATQACVAVSGFYCQNPIYHGNTLTFSFGQATGTSWATANIIFVPFGNSYNSVCTTGTGGNCASIGGFSSGQTTSVSIPETSQSIGATLQGYLYAQYTVSGGTSLYSTQVGTVTVKST